MQERRKARMKYKKNKEDRRKKQRNMYREK